MRTQATGSSQGLFTRTVMMYICTKWTQLAMAAGTGKLLKLRNGCLKLAAASCKLLRLFIMEHGHQDGKVFLGLPKKSLMDFQGCPGPGGRIDTGPWWHSLCCGLSLRVGTLDSPVVRSPVGWCALARLA